MNPFLRAARTWAVCVAIMLGLAAASRAEAASVPEAQGQPVPSPQWQAVAGETLKFEVASVRPSAPGTPYRSNVSLDGLDGLPPGSLLNADASLHSYLLFAFKISDSNQARAIYFKLPAWAKPPQFFNIQARAGADATRDQMRVMMQALLTDRFKLAIHREMQPQAEYALRLNKAGKLGPQLRPHAEGEPCVKSPGAIIDPPVKGTDVPSYCGMVTWRVDGQQHIRMVDVTMAQMASAVSGLSGSMAPHSGVDVTGLAGRFDVDLEFVPETSAGSADATGPTFAEALRSQLGVTIVERNVPVEILVIDHVEKPSEN
jgi:bla regulator protein BlaR1